MAAVRIGQTRRVFAAIMMMTASAIVCGNVLRHRQGRDQRGSAVRSSPRQHGSPNGHPRAFTHRGFVVVNDTGRAARLYHPQSSEERTGVRRLQYHGLVRVEQKVLRLRDCGCGGGNARRSFVPASLDGISAVGRRNLLTSSAIVLFVAVIPLTDLRSWPREENELSLCPSLATSVMGTTPHNNSRDEVPLHRNLDGQ